MLLLAWLFLKPIFWAMIAVLGFVIAIVIFVLIISAFSGADTTLREQTDTKENVSQHESIGEPREACVPDRASSTSKEANMTHDKRFALVDRQGDARYAAIIAGSYQVGKERDQLPCNIEEFARAILIEGKGGRFVCADGRKPAVLKYGGRAREACAYELDPAIAQRLGLPSQGRR